MANPYLESNVAPIEREYTSTRLEVTGELPGYLDGRYLRNGPNPLEPDPEKYHWFMGDGMVHGVRLRDGRAEWYRNRWIRTPYVAGMLGEGPRVPRTMVGANTHVIEHAGRTLALVEGGMPQWELTEELDTVGLCDFDGTLPGGGYTAHPKRDPKTGELHAVSVNPGFGNKVQYSVVGADGRVRRLEDIEVTGQPIMHELSLTERYVVFYDLPVNLVIRSDFTLDSMPAEWNPDYPPRVGVMPREGGNSDVRWFDVEPCFVYHALNAYDDGDRVVLDVVRHETVLNRSKIAPGDGETTVDRWTIDLVAGKVVEERLDDNGQELPRIDERRVSLPHRYGYTTATDAATLPTGKLYKHDVVNRSVQTHRFGSGREPGEFVFVPSGVDAAEDDGVLMGFVYDATAAHSDLVLLDAASLETVAEVHLPVRVPHGFHGSWLPKLA
ncbi:carotenoid oxygenase family protein [Amycolatopsis jejuensis]|uniref:carotenoid oxygenase family protein n=1 Tax=Amycolatopsis jejuensis TaxID=330084 RepID=UPI000526FDDE|nr:carotenoid oxygenase family protein [Amycolatopsis jejuensis]